MKVTNQPDGLYTIESKSDIVSRYQEQIDEDNIRINFEENIHIKKEQTTNAEESLKESKEPVPYLGNIKNGSFGIPYSVKNKNITIYSSFLFF